ncbi:MAG: cysteine--tRNA ligase [Deltaproteobacteria bacterium]|nr:cysteine--tRNA ligase [Deltaproteobacteria bacterium]
MDKEYKIPGSILDLIGNTPLVPVSRINPNKNVRILAKLESFNPGGSIKDRPALQMIEDAEKSGELTKNKTILEATSGNTGIGLALVAAVKGYRIMLVMSEAVSDERKKTLRALGAELRFTPAHMSTDGAIELVYELIRNEPENYWLADQFNNESNWKAHYNTTAMEIWEQTGGKVDAVVASLGTSGTVMGLSRRLKELNSDIRIIAMEPYLGHKIQGLKNMKESYNPGIYDKNRIDRTIRVDDDEAYQTARLLAKKEGIFCGMSSGAAMATAIRVAKEMDSGTIVVIIPDGGDRYLSTTLFEDRKKTGLLFYNTVTRKKEEFIPIEKNRAKIYTCGPTLSQPIHIGQCRRFVFSDLLRRYLEFKGFDVTHVMNVTDLDDRTIQGAEKAGKPLREFTERYYDEFLEDLNILNIKRASEYPKASENIDEMIELAAKLLEKGYAYEKFRSLYFDIGRFRDYGKLSRIDLNKIKLGKTVDLEQYEKDNPRDFTLLKRSTLDELKKGIYYQTKWGNIRPSWHLECPAMSMKYLGDSYDIHTSGIDLIFPHHENSIAIMKAVTGKSPANYWLHNELVMIDRKKPSQLSDPEYYIKNILKEGYSGREIRYWLLCSHYRKPVSFSWKKLDMAKKTLSNLDKFVARLYTSHEGESNSEIDQLLYDLKNSFIESMDDDLNIAPALAAIFKFVNKANKLMDNGGISGADRKKIISSLVELNSVIAVFDLKEKVQDEEVTGLIKRREEARRQKDWKTSDRIRDELREKYGIEITDTAEGAVCRKMN